jgi:hypothetical protein
MAFQSLQPPSAFSPSRPGAWSPGPGARSLSSFFRRHSSIVANVGCSDAARAVLVLDRSSSLSKMRLTPPVVGAVASCRLTNRFGPGRFACHRYGVVFPRHATLFGFLASQVFGPSFPVEHGGVQATHTNGRGQPPALAGAEGRGTSLDDGVDLTQVPCGHGKRVSCSGAPAATRIGSIACPRVGRSSRCASSSRENALIAAACVGGVDGATGTGWKRSRRGRTNPSSPLRRRGRIRSTWPMWRRSRRLTWTIPMTGQRASSRAARLRRQRPTRRRSCRNAAASHLRVSTDPARRCPASRSCPVRPALPSYPSLRSIAGVVTTRPPHLLNDEQQHPGRLSPDLARRPSVGSGLQAGTRRDLGRSRGRLKALSLRQPSASPGPEP